MAIDPTKLMPGDKFHSPTHGECVVVAVGEHTILSAYYAGDHKYVTWTKCESHWCECTLLPRKNAVIPGVSPNEPIIENEQGGKQSAVPYRMDLVPPKALLAVAHTLHDGAEKYGVDNWRKIGRHDHLNHALTHIYALLAGDTSDDHLLHAACRVMFAIETN